MCIRDSFFTFDSTLPVEEITASKVAQSGLDPTAMIPGRVTGMMFSDDEEFSFGDSFGGIEEDDSIGYDLDFLDNLLRSW